MCTAFSMAARAGCGRHREGRTCEVLRLRDERRGSVAFLHELRVSGDEGPWNVTVPFVFLMRPDVPFAVCMPIGGQTAKGTGDVPAKGAGTHEDE
jgi:hypothetical protein